MRPCICYTCFVAAKRLQKIACQNTNSKSLSKSDGEDSHKSRSRGGKDSDVSRLKERKVVIMNGMRFSEGVAVARTSHLCILPKYMET